MSIRLNGSTSGYVEIDAPAVAGSTSITLPATSGGEVVVTDSSGNIDLGPLDINGSAADDSVNIDGSGRLLVGSSSPTFTTQLTEFSGDNSFYIHALKNETASDSNGARYSYLAFIGTQSGGEQSILASVNAAHDGSSDDTKGTLSFRTNSGSEGGTIPTERMRIRADGTVATTGGFGIGNVTQAIANSFYIASTAIGIGAGNSTLKYNTSSGLVSYDTSSALVKENIIDCPYGIDAIKQLQPRKYFRIDDQREEIGFVADEVVNVLPEYVPVGPKSVITKDESDTEEIPLGVHYDKLTAVLTKALQEAIAKIETLEAINASFEARLTALEGGQP